MYVAMNRFRVRRGQEEAFERIWVGRDSRLGELPGFVSFKLLRGPQTEEHTLYASQGIWADRAAFDNWTNSEQFRHAHGDGGATRDVVLGPPQFEGFEVVKGA